MRYISEEAGQHLLAYEYHGCDLSYVYRFVLTPMNRRLIEYIPLWVAPNVITLAGFCFVLLALSVGAYHSPDMAHPLPFWVHPFLAACLFIYQTLDNLDGRQARRTGNSSPLGLLFDHGVDAVTVCLAGGIVAIAMRIGGNWKLVWLLMIGMSTFSFATWEEYYSNTLILGVINGPTDGNLIAMAFCLAPFLAQDQDFWLHPMEEGLFRALPWDSVHAFTGIPEIGRWPMHMLVLGMSIIAVPPTLLSNIYGVVNAQLKRGVSISKAFVKLFPFIVHFTALYVWTLHSPSNIISRHPVAVTLITAFVFGNLACKLMLAHLCNHEYGIMRHSLLPMLALSVNSLLGAPLSELPLMLASLCYALLSWMHFVISVCNELTQLLGIRVFVTKPLSKDE